MRTTLAAVAGAALLAACGSSPTTGPSSPAPSTSMPTATPSAVTATPVPSPEPTSPRPLPTVTPTSAPQNLSPLSGRPGGGGKQMLAVKIDNTPAAQPQAGLRVADVVWIQEVEGGYTRLLALFASKMPDKVGPVRSARISDISLLAPFGDIAFAYSGAQTKLLPYLDQSPMVLTAPEKVSPGWERETWRPVSYINLMADPQALLNWAGSTSRVPQTGWVFDAAVPDGGRTLSEVEATWPGSRMSFRWDARRGGFVVSANGALTESVGGGPQVASTVIIQKVRQSDSGFGDRYGGRTPLIETVGKGTALVARDGRFWSARWERNREQDITRYTLADGTVMSFAPGQVWIALLAGTPTVR